MKIVLRRNVEFDFESVAIFHDHYKISDLEEDNYVVVSEVVDVEFPMLPEVDLTSKKIEAIDRDIEKAKAGLYLLEQAKAELLAIPDMSEGE